MHRIALENLTEFRKNYPAELLQALVRTTGINGARIYLVGGTVRDCLLGLVSHDLDFAVSGDVLITAKILQRELGGGTIVDLSGPDDQAIRIVWRGEQVDLAATNPVKLKELIEKYKVYATENGIVIPDLAVAYAKPPKLKSF